MGAGASHSEGSGRLLARWREAGEWWCGGEQREVAVYLDRCGVRRTKVRSLGSLGSAEGVSCDPESTPPEDHRVDLALRVQKVRDEKVLKACGLLVEPKGAAHLGETPPLACLHALSGYAFGRGAMLAEEVAGHAARGGWGAALLADPFSLAGASEFDKMACKLGLRPLIGATLELDTGGELVLVAQSRVGFRSLSRLITECHLDEPRLFPLATWERLERHSQGLMCLTGGSGGPVDRALIRRDHAEVDRLIGRLMAIYGPDRVFVEVERSFLPWQISVEARLLELAERHGLTLVAGGPITHARPGHFPAQDVLTCVETLCEIEEVIGRKPRRAPSQLPTTHPPSRALNAERFLRTASEMAELFRDRPELIAHAWRLAERCDPDVLPPPARLPTLTENDGAVLREVTYFGARQRHGKVTGALHRRLEHELNRIVGLGFASHFLIAWDFCDWARARGCVFSGRGSVVDSAVAYCLGLSRIDAFKHRLHFDRFLPADGSKRPDIDIDFEAHRRDEVRGYLAGKYGSDHVATVAAVGAFCTRGIVREVGKVMGLPEETTAYLAKRLHGSVTPDRLEAALDARPELARSGIPRERFRWVFRLAQQLMDMPRNMRAHSSGVVLSDQPIRDTIPVQHSGVEAVKIIQWDKRSAKRCFDKFDILCLRGNDVLADAAERIRLREPVFDADTIPYDQPDVYRAMRSGKLIGIPQSASPAMRQAHVRIRTQDLNDASLVQAGIRPGVGGAVKINELIARRRGKPYAFSHPAFEAILGHTYGIVIFQEQIDQLLQTFVGCSCGEAEEIRESIHKRRREGYAEAIQADLRRRVVAHGFARQVAAEAVELICAFQGYGFAQGHALAFAEISLRSVYCQQNYPAEYFAALLNAQPAGYYGPCTLTNEARARGVKVLPPDVNRSELGFSVEDVVSEQDPKLVFPNGGLRVGLMQISDVSEVTRKSVVEERRRGLALGFSSLPDFVRRVRPGRDELERLILCGALDGLYPNRRAMLWTCGAPWLGVALDPAALPMELPEPEPDAEIADFTEAERALHERAILDLDVRRHLMAFEREHVCARGGLAAKEVETMPHGTGAFVVGNPLRLRFPPTQSGRRVVFFDLEDESGLLNVTMFDDAYQRDGHALICSPWVTVRGEVQDRDGYPAFLAHRVFAYRPVLGTLVAERSLEQLQVGDFLAK